jgi:diguanylate cyclase (GGDEF)-like protein
MMQEMGVREARISPQMDGPDTPEPGPRAARSASRAGQHARTRLASRALDHLPLAVAVIDRTQRLLYWNVAAAGLLNLPSMMQSDTPPLADGLRDGGRVTSRQISRITAFCDVAIAGKDSQSWLRLSFSRQHRITVRVTPMGGDRWIVGFEELHSLGRALGEGTDAMIDPLTGLSNRRHFMEALQEFEVAAESPSRHAILLFDLDRFQAINDRLGRAVGDALLAVVAQRLRRETRDEDVVARLGGDEFVILQPHGEGAEALADRVLQIASRPFMIEGHIVNIGASVGIARASAVRETPDVLIQHAGLALYMAKTSGRQTWRLYEPSLAHRAAARQGLERDLRSALALGEFSLLCQPQCDLATRQPVGFCAALRWNHPARGDVARSVFLPLAEEIACAGALHEWLLTTACAAAARWAAPLNISVAVATQQLDDPAGLCEVVRAALAASGLPASRLDIVLNGPALMAREQSATELMQRLHEMGVRLTMVGFGAGWGTLRQMRAFPFDRVKIDNGLIRALRTDAETAAMVRAITTLAADLGMASIAEGASTPEQVAILAAQGCVMLEGGVAGPALHLDAVGAFLVGTPSSDEAPR